MAQVVQVNDIPYTINGKRVEVPVKKASQLRLMNIIYLESAAFEPDIRIPRSFTQPAVPPSWLQRVD